MKPPVVDNPWATLRRFTPARIALGRAGTSVPTAAQLAFQLAHAQARDAVQRAFDAGATAAAVAALGLATTIVRSAACDRATYLLRPDLGRRLDPESARALHALAAGRDCDLALVVADGLSALAVERHAPPLLAALLPLLRAAATWTLGPVAVVHQGRVAIGDEVGAALRARLALVAIGERPGLSSPDSLGLYLTWAPQPGRTDAQRNCISNIRPEGLSYDEAAHRAAWLLAAARARRLTGIALKDQSTAPPALDRAAEPGFRLTDDSREPGS